MNEIGIPDYTPLSGIGIELGGQMDDSAIINSSDLSSGNVKEMEKSKNDISDSISQGQDISQVNVPEYGIMPIQEDFSSVPHNTLMSFEGDNQANDDKTRIETGHGFMLSTDEGRISQLPTPSLTSNSTISNSCITQPISESFVVNSQLSEIQQNLKSFIDDNEPSANPEIKNDASNALNSLAKLRQFKAEVEATRHNKTVNSAGIGNGTGIGTGNGNRDNNNDGVVFNGVAEMDPSQLAKMAESFILQQQKRLGSSSNIPPEGEIPSSKEGIKEDDVGNNEIKIAREQELKRKLKSRSLSRTSDQNQILNTNTSRSQSPIIGIKRELNNDQSDDQVHTRGREYIEDNKRIRENDNRKIGQTQQPQLPANPPWLDRDRSNGNPNTNSNSNSNRNSPIIYKFQPPHPNDPRFTKRENSDSRVVNYKPSETNFVPARYQRSSESGNDNIESRRYSAGKSRTPPSRKNELPINKERSYSREKDDYDYVNDDRGQRGNRSEGHKLADRISGLNATPKYRRRSSSPSKNRQRQPSPPRSRVYARQPSPPRHYPDPRTPVVPAYTRRDDKPDPYETYAYQRAPPTGPRGNVPEPYARAPSPNYSRVPPPLPPPSRDYGRDPRYAADPRNDPYSRPPPPPEYRRPIEEGYGRPSGSQTLLPGSGVDTNNVVETLEALKAQISKLEKLVPTNFAPPTPAPPPPPPPIAYAHHGQGRGEYDPYVEYARQYDIRPRSPHPREREYDPKPQPSRAYPPVPPNRGGPPSPQRIRYEDNYGQGYPPERGHPHPPGPPRGHGKPNYEYDEFEGDHGGRGRPGRGGGHGSGGRGGNGRGGGRRGKRGRGGR